MAARGKHKRIDSTKKKKIIKIIIITVLILIAAGVACFKWIQNNKKKEETVIEAATSTVIRGNVQATISGSGTVEPNERYEVIPLVNGEIISAPYDVGDFVKEGAVVYEFDTTDVEINLEKQRNSMQKSTITYNESLDQKDDLIIKAPCSGVVREVEVKIGDDVTAGKQITQIVNTQELKVKLPFNETQVAGIKEGDSAILTSSVAMSSISGIVSNVSSTPEAGMDGTSLYYVTVDFQNPGAVAEGDSFGGSVNDIVSPGAGTVSYSESDVVTTSIEGKISDLYCKEGDYVNEGDVLVELTSEKLENTLKKSKIEYEDAKLSLENQENQLDDYRVTAPISGTVLTKNSKLGDTIDRTNSSVTMMVIGDVSKLKFTLSIDELDVSKIKIGQKVNITADAIAGKTFEGEITEIAMEGTASNGVTTYAAIVTINNPQELKPSMNVDAVVVVESAQNTLLVPSSDITTAMGRSFVFVKDDAKEEDKKDNKKDSKKADKKSKDKKTDEEKPENTVEPFIQDIPKEAMGSGRPGMVPGSSTAGSASGTGSYQRPQGSSSGLGTQQRPSSAGTGEGRVLNTQDANRQQGAGTQGANSPSGVKAPRLPEAPEGFKTVEIIIGVQGDEYTQVISGLFEGQEIYQKQTKTSSGSMPFAMGGGMNRSGMPSGMGGGMSGNMGGSMNRSAMGGAPR